MGKLYRAAMMKQELKENFVREELRAAGVTHHLGKPLEQCNYDELKSEMVLLTFRRIDVEKEKGWF